MSYIVIQRISGIVLSWVGSYTNKVETGQVRRKNKICMTFMYWVSKDNEVLSYIVIQRSIRDYF